MKYIKYANYSGQKLNADEMVLMSSAEFKSGGKNLKNVPIAITPDGSEPIEIEGGE